MDSNMEAHEIKHRNHIAKKQQSEWKVCDLGFSFSNELIHLGEKVL